VDQLLGNLEEGRKKSEESLALFRKTGDRRGAVYPLRNLGWIANSRGDYETAVSCFEEALRSSREAGDSRGVGFCLTYLAWVRITRAASRKPWTSSRRRTSPTAGLAISRSRPFPWT
jgi:tetratricopeptide (TPR) repeat protein